MENATRLSSLEWGANPTLQCNRGRRLILAIDRVFVRPGRISQEPNEVPSFSGALRSRSEVSMRAFSSFLLLACLTASAVADIAPGPPGGKRPPRPPSSPPSSGPGGGQVDPRSSDPSIPGPTATNAPSAATADSANLERSIDPMLASADLPPPSAPADDDERMKVIGAIVLVIGVYVATRLLRRGSAKPE